MKFDNWCDEILRHGHSYSLSGGLDLSLIDREKRDQWLAAAASVIARNGEQWCRDNQFEFGVEIGNQLKTWVRVGLFIASVLGFANPFLRVAAWLLPVLVDWLHERAASRISFGGSAIDWPELAADGKATAFG